ncbi:MAG: AAA family ATPase [Lutibacter sp.]
MDTNNNQNLRKVIPNDPMLQRLLKESEIDPYSTIEDSSPILKIDNIPYGTRMNFSALIGKPKSRKTFLSTLLIAGCLDGSNEFERFSSSICNTNILHFDTEQSRNHVLKTSKRVIQLLNKKDKINNYKIYSFRKHDSNTRMQLIEEAIYTIENVSLVIIDGIADLVTSYNDEEQASFISQKLMKWSEERNIHIIVIIHQNKGDDNAKGHLGSYIIQKAETVLSVTKDKNRNISIVKPVFSRNVDLNLFKFSIDENGLPFLIDNEISILVDESSDKSPDKFPQDFDENFKISLLNGIYLNNLELKKTREVLISEIQLNLKNRGFDVGINKCRDWLNFYKNNDLIYQEKDKGPYRLRNGLVIG